MLFVFAFDIQHYPSLADLIVLFASVVLVVDVISMIHPVILYRSSLDLNDDLAI